MSDELGNKVFVKLRTPLDPNSFAGKLMNDTQPIENKTPTHMPFFNLSPATLAQVLKSAVDKPETMDQQIYLDALLLNVANTATTIMEQEGRTAGALQARKQSPASSIGRVGIYEKPLYDLIYKATKEEDLDNIKAVVKPQTMTFTCHPNFSRSRALVRLSKELAEKLGTLSRDEQQKIIDTKELPKEGNISRILDNIKAELKLRTKRTRHDELQETTLDMIPTVMEAAAEQLRIFKKRDGIFEKHDPFANLKQLEAAAALLPEYNSWFLDGDGKRSVHSYDAEVAVPAIKRATYQEYAESLEKLTNVAGVTTELKRLRTTISILEEVEDFAKKRMNAFNEMQTLYDAKQDNPDDHDLRSKYEVARKTAEECSKDYEDFIHGKVEDEKVIDIMRRNDAAPLKEKVGAILEQAYANEKRDDDLCKTAEDLYIKLTHFGNYAVHIQRRENAQQYNQVFKYLVQNDAHIRSAIVEKLSPQFGDRINMETIEHQLFKPEIYSHAVKAFATIIKEKNPSIFDVDKDGNPRDLLKHYSKIARKLGSRDDEAGRIVEPLERRELLALDDLGMFRMANLYPEAFKGGFVIAEFGQPDMDFLRDNKSEPEKIKTEVARIAKNDLTLQMALASAMGASNVEIIPLHEDPSTMQYATDAQQEIRTPSFMDYMKKWIGITTPAGTEDRAVAEAKTLKHVDDQGNVQKLTAYQYMRQLGYSDEELRMKDLEKSDLQNMFVLEGPHDMEACSDNNKRAGMMGSLLADQSIRGKVLEAAKLPVKVGNISYMIVKPKYLGQGGSIARAVEIPLDAGQATWQGEHTASFTPTSLAHKAYNYLLGRLYMRETGARAVTPVEHVTTLAEKYPHVGNVLGLLGSTLADNEHDTMLATINKRLASTRDDERYNIFLKRYGEPVSNWSARPDAKGGSGEGIQFNEGRAIGIAGLESGIFSNIIAFAEVFEPLPKEEAKVAVDRIRKWKQKDPMMQQLITAASLTANFVNLEEKWKRGGFVYTEEGGQGFVHKLDADTKKIAVSTLARIYDEKGTNHTDATTGVIFNEGDLVMAHLTEQYQKMLVGLVKLHDENNKPDQIGPIKSREDLLKLLPKPHREDVRYFRDINDKVLYRWHEMKDDRKKGATDPEERPDLKVAGRLALDAYYLLHESGSVYPLPALLEESLFTAARASAATDRSLVS